eukprot:TRINITY_DN4445_c0_g1_i10.p1 TRINITY_DN4445_c0_g1~~TRINITY_DN4445_c0_g1_i10.p1  ORF type:complete len:1767 (+),score=483.03 TRINITY_DN4445_c0_g1_i10:323-5623(+)
MFAAAADQTERVELYPEFFVGWKDALFATPDEPTGLPKVVDFCLFPSLVDDLSEKDQRTSLFMVKFLSKMFRYPLSYNDEATLKKHAEHFKVLDLTMYNLPHVKAVTSYLRKNRRPHHFKVERAALACWDDDVLGSLPHTLTALVLTVQQTNDDDIATIRRRCPSLASLRIENGNGLSSKAATTITSFIYIDHLYLKADHKISLDKLGQLESMMCDFVFEFSLSPDFMSFMKKEVKDFSAALHKKVESVLKKVENPEEILKPFDHEKLDTENLLTSFEVLVPKVACNAMNAVEVVKAEFFTLLADSLGIVSFLVLRRVGIFDACDQQYMDEWRAYKPSWGRQCEITYSRPDEITTADWFISRFVTGLLRGRLDVHHRRSHGNIRSNAFFKWVQPNVLALDLGRLPINDDDLSNVITCFPAVRILLLSDVYTISSASVSQLVQLPALRYVRLSGAVQVGQQLVARLREHGVSADFNPLSSAVTAAVRETAARMCADFNKAVSRAVTRVSRRRVLHRRYALYDRCTRCFLAKALHFFELLHVNADVLPAACTMFLDQCAELLTTPAFEALFQMDTHAWEKELASAATDFCSEDEEGEAEAAQMDSDQSGEESDREAEKDQLEMRAGDGGGLFLVAVDPAKAWLRHLAWSRLDSYRQKAEEERVAVASTPPPTPTPVGSTSVLSSLLPFLKIKSECDGNDVTTYETVEQRLKDTTFKCTPTLTPRQLALSDMFRSTFDSLLLPIAAVGTGAKPTAEQAEQLQLWAMYGEHESAALLVFLREHVLLPPQRQVHVRWLEKDREVTTAVLQLVQLANSSGERIRGEDFASVLERAYSQPGTCSRLGLSAVEIAAHCRHLRSLHVALADFFCPPGGRSSAEAERRAYVAKMTAAQACGLWRYAVAHELLATFLPYYCCPTAATLQEKDVLINPYLARHVLLCSVIGCDAVPALELRRAGLSALLSKLQRELLWRGVCNAVSPAYCVFAKESPLSFEDHWRPWSFSLYKRERPRGMPSRNYVLERMFSYVMHDPTRASATATSAVKLAKTLTAWERQLWDHGTQFLQSIDLSDVKREHFKRLGGALRLVSERKCPLLAVNLQNTAVNAEALGYLPSTVTCVNFNDSPVTDDMLTVVARRCPHLRFLFLRDCRLITDTGLRTVCHVLAELRLVDVSGNMHISDEAVAQVVVKSKGRLRVELARFTTYLKKKFWSQCSKIAQNFTKQLHIKLKEVPDVAPLADRAVLRALVGNEKLAEFVPEQLCDLLSKYDVPQPLVLLAFKKAFKSVMYELSALAALVAEALGWLGAGLSDDDCEDVWHKVYHNTSEVTEKEVKPPEVCWKRHCLEGVIAVRVLRNITVRDFAALHPRKHLLWCLGRSYIRKLDFVGNANNEFINAVLQDVQQQGLAIDQLHITSEVATVLRVFPPSVSRVFVHGAVLPEQQQAELQRHAHDSDIALEFVTSGGSCDELDSGAAKLAADFSATLKKILYEKSVQQIVDGVLRAVAKFKSRVDEFLQQLDLAPPSVALACSQQFLCRCLSFLDVAPLVALEATGTALFLAENQQQCLWRAVAERRALDLSGLPDGVPVRDYVLGLFVSKEVKEFGVDREVLLVLRYAPSIYHIDLTGVDILFTIPSKVASFSMLDGATLCHSVVTAITQKDALQRLYLRGAEVLQEVDVQEICDAFPNVEVLEVMGSRHLTLRCLSCFLALRRLHALTVELTLPVDVASLERLCALDDNACELFAQLGGARGFVILKNEWLQGGPSLPLPLTAER